MVPEGENSSGDISSNYQSTDSQTCKNDYGEPSAMDVKEIKALE